MECKLDDCHRVARRKKRQLCLYHERQERNIKCAVCDEPSVRNNNPLCSRHSQREKLDLPLEKEKRQYGDSYITKNGYVMEYMPGHPQAFSDGRVLQHRRIYSDILGRTMYKFENVHHKNGDRADNRLENLELWIIQQPPGQRVEDVIQWAKWILEEYNERL